MFIIRYPYSHQYKRVIVIVYWAEYPDEVIHFESKLTLNVNIMNFGPRFSIRNTEKFVCFNPAQRVNF